MKLVGYSLFALLFLATLGVLGYFLWPLLHPETVSGTAPVTFSESRTQTVKAAGRVTSQAESELEKKKAAEAKAGAGEPSGPLCDQQFSASQARPFPNPAGRLMKRGPEPDEAAWTWVNFWAAWCKPCKEEMPVLSRWATRLRGSGRPLHVTFLSLDDDERQLRRYLEGEGRGLAGAVLWVEDEAVRARFFASLGLPNPPTLPVQVLVDPQDRVRCVRVGSITEGELDQAAKVFGF
jgi:thiol-disulfide isomerase/thioredoxin